MTAGFVLSAPWGLFDTAGEARGGRRATLPEGGGTAIVPAGLPVVLACGEDVAPTVDSRYRGIEAEGPAFDFGRDRQRLWILDVGTKPSENGTIVRAADGRAWRLEYKGFLPRPGFAAGRQGAAPVSLHAERLDDFIFGCVERIRSGDDADLGMAGWDALDKAWSEARLDPDEPPRELIVKHAETYSRLLADLVRSPRRLLRRDRDMVAVDRVQQLDVACIRWLTRQPGRDVYEQAGPRQRILAVVREDDLDTLENRVLRDFAARSAELARSYCSRFKARYGTSDRWRMVDRYRMECRRAETTLAGYGIGLPVPPIVPNYALLRHQQYGRIWTGYREILRRLDDQDECWRWQHRLWADYSRLAVQLAVRRWPGAEIVAEAPLRIFEEQRRGRWTSLGGQSGAFLIRRKGDRPPIVVSVVADLSEPHERVPDWMAGLCPSAVLVVDELGTDRTLYVPVWGLHSCSDERLDPAGLARSADRALTSAIGQHRLIHGGEEDPIVGGLVVVSGAATIDGRGNAREGRVRAVVLGPEGEAMRTGMRHLENAVQTMAEDMLRAAQ